MIILTIIIDIEHHLKSQLLKHYKYKNFALHRIYEGKNFDQYIV